MFPFAALHISYPGFFKLVCLRIREAYVAKR